MTTRETIGRRATIALAVWLLAGVAGALHRHDGDTRGDGGHPCVACVAAKAPVADVPEAPKPVAAAVVVVAKEQIVSDAPTDVVKDVPLARGPPSAD